MIAKSGVILGLFATLTSSETSTNERRGRFFFVSTLSTTSVVSTTTICWKSNAAITAVCTGRKRRFINLGKWRHYQRHSKVLNLDHDMDDVDIKASVPLASDFDDESVSDLAHKDDKNLLLNSGLEEYKDDVIAREARFLLYWATSTSYTTSTTYTATSTLATLECTPPSFTISACG